MKDWQNESSRMGDVYAHGYCNIATAQSVQESGFFVTRNPLAIKPLFVETTENWSHSSTPTKMKKYVIHRAFNEWKDDIENAMLNQRAWVFQERAMSPRTLYFGRNQIYWECSSSRASEAWPSLRLLLTGLKYVYHSNIETMKENLEDADIRLHWWSELVRTYSKTRITVETDRLIALAGMAKSLGLGLGLGMEQLYLAGLWRKDLMLQLLWSIGHSSKRFGIRPERYIAPTWSWASVRGEIWWLNLDPIFYFATLVDAKVTPITSDIFGQITSGFIKIRGPLVKGLILNAPALRDHLPDFSLDQLVEADFDTLEYIDLKEIYCLPIIAKSGYASRLQRLRMAPKPTLTNNVNIHGLMLVPTGRIASEFKRCGKFLCFGKKTILFRKALKRFGESAETSGLPFEEREKGNEFIVTII